MQYHETLGTRLASKLVLDFLPAAAASLLGGLLFTHYGLGRVTEPAAQVAPASPEMMQLLRDEHGLMVAFLNAELARERNGLTAEDAVRSGSGEAATTANTPHPPAQRPAAVAAKPALSRVRMVVAASASPPLVIAQVQTVGDVRDASPVSQSLIAKTIDLKDHVVSVTHRVVSVLGGISGWIGLTHLGAPERSRPASDMVTAS